MKQLSVRTFFAGLFGVVVSAGPAGAAGFQLKEQSAEGLGNAFAGSTAKAYDLSTAFYNPAGLTRLQGTRAQNEVTFVVARTRFKGGATDLSGRNVGGPDGGNPIELGILPSLYGMIDVSDDLKLGFAMNVPFGMVTNYDDNWAGRYQALASDVQFISVTPSVAYRAIDHPSFGKLSIGGGPVFQYANVVLSSAINQSQLLGQSPGALPDARLKIEGKDKIAFGLNLGLLWEPTDATRFGINYRSRVRHRFSGQAIYSGFVGPAAAQNRKVGARADMTTPDTVSFGAYHDINDQWAVVGDFSWSNWNLFDALDVKAHDGSTINRAEEQWGNSFFFSLGGIYRPTENWSLRFGAAYETSPVEKEYMTARIPDADRYWLSLGATYEFTDQIVLTAGYTHIFTPKVNINETHRHSSSGQGTLAGHYDSSVDIISIGGRFSF